MQLLMVCLLVGVTMSALVYASALQQCYQKLAFGHVQKKNNRYLLLIHVTVKQFIGEVK